MRKYKMYNFSTLEIFESNSLKNVYKAFLIWTKGEKTPPEMIEIIEVETDETIKFI